MLQHLTAKDETPARVVVVGSAGFVGGAVASRLENGGVAVVRVTRREVDLLAKDAADRLRALLKPNDVLVAAAAMAPCKNADMLRDNMILTAAIIKAAKGAQLAQVINVGSDAVYADGPLPLSESSPMAPDSLHGAMHLAREIMFKAEVDAPLATIRPSLLYGAGDPHNGYGPNRFLRLNAKGEQITLFGEGEERRDHVYIDDVAALAARMIYRRSVGALNIATGAVESFRGVAELVNRIAGKTVPIKPTPRTGPMPHNGYRPFDAAATYKAFPDFTYTPLPAGLAKAHSAQT